MTKRQSVLLLQPPFIYLNEPSCALGRLKASLLSENISCDCNYSNLELAVCLDRELRDWMNLRSTGTFFGEILYASELFPDWMSEQDYLQTMCSFYKRDIDKNNIFKALYREVRCFNRNMLGRWRRDFPYTVVGISANYNLLPSLFFASKLKQLHPNVQVVLGGSECTGEIGHAIARTFPFLDWVVDGEGEEVLPEIVRIAARDSDEVPSGTCRRIGNRVVVNNSPRKPVDLDKLPFPDYDDYFNSEAFRKVIEESVGLPVEASRGCWWGKCAFCNFTYCDRHKYRRMSDERVVKTMEYLAKRHKYLVFHFVDAVQPTNIVSLAETIANSPYDFEFCMSLRADIPSRHLSLLAKAGLWQFFLGVESFNDRTLKMMNKGTTAIDNLMVLRAARELGLEVDFIVISPYPGETRKERTNNAYVMKSAPHLFTRVLQTELVVKYGSPIYFYPAQFGIKKIFPAHNYKLFLPPSYRFKPTFYWDYLPKPRMQKVVPKSLSKDESLELLVGGDRFCVVKDRRSTSRERNDYTLTPPHSNVLTACITPRKRHELKCRDKVLKDLINLGFLVESNGTYLTLAIEDKKLKRIRLIDERDSVD